MVHPDAVEVVLLGAVVERVGLVPGLQARRDAIAASRRERDVVRPDVLEVVLLEAVVERVGLVPGLQARRDAIVAFRKESVVTALTFNLSISILLPC